MDVLKQADVEVWQAIQGERQRQQQGLEMIASENYTSPAVLAAQGSVLTNKYAEGYPGRRYYGGCEYVDVVERLAIDRVLQSEEGQGTVFNLRLPINPDQAHPTEQNQDFLRKVLLNDTLWEKLLVAE